MTAYEHRRLHPILTRFDMIEARGRHSVLEYIRFQEKENT
jgi:hypothetical protein